MGKTANDLSQLTNFDNYQDINECRKSILKLSQKIYESDLTSTKITSMRILSLRALLDLFENYNHQLKVLRKEISK